jgi:molybdopterin-guanine dinucleotide biosynthesis protein B
MRAHGPGPKVIGVAGWKNSGKTTLVARLITELTRRGFKVASVKHAHHTFQIDDADTDSARHRRAGAQQVAVVSGRRWALVRELDDEPEPALEAILARLDPCDLVIVEGYKNEPIPKIEVRLKGAHTPALYPDDPRVIAIATDDVLDTALPQVDVNDPEAVANLIIQHLGLNRARLVR